MATLLVLQNLETKIRLLAIVGTHKVLFNLKEDVGVCNVVEPTCVIDKPELSPIMTSSGPPYSECSDRFAMSFVI